MKRLVIFPYNPDIEILVRNKELLNGFSLAGVCSYKEDWRLTKKINEELGVENDEDKMIDQCDILLLAENYRNFNMEKYYDILDKAVERNKEILVSPRLREMLDLKKYKGEYSFLQKGIKRTKGNEGEKYVIEVPVIAVEGMGKNCSKFENQIDLKKMLERNGYQVSWISSNELAMLFGGTVFPASFYSDKRSFEKKVLLCMRYLYTISISEKPDVMIVGIPGGIAEFEANEKNHYGEYALIVGNAVQIDSSILCLYFEERVSSKGIEELSNYVKNRCFLPVRAVSIGKNTYQIDEGMEEEISYLFLQQEYLKKYSAEPNKNRIPIFRIWEDEERELALKRIVDELQENAYCL